MLTRTMLALTVFAAGMFLLAGCGSAPEKPSPSKELAPEARPQPNPQPQPGAPGNEGDVRGLRIIAAPREGEPDDFRAFSMFPGTTVALAVPYPAGGIVEVDTQSSKIAEFADDTGFDLLNAPQISKWASSGFDGLPAISPDGKRALVEVKAHAIPKTGAKSLRVAGELTMRVATEKKTFTSALVAVKEGAKIDAGPIPFTITRPQKAKNGQWTYSITLKAERNVNILSEVRFLDESGKPLETWRGGGMRSGWGDHWNVEMEYLFKQPLTNVKAELTYWMDLKDVKVPFRAQAGVGF
ncbi:MAG: hypothetical protein KIS92_03665 [Planctomycetota bacterium]|nr:hypothetical protein [Planctomycetota bacterium]